jgi:methionyl-tRNA formyltransferase
MMASGMRVKIFPPCQVVPGLSIAAGLEQVCDDGLLVGCGTDALRLSLVQAEGGKRVNATDFARGQRGEIRFV